MLKINDFSFTNNGLAYCTIHDCMNETICVHESSDLKEPRIWISFGDDLITLDKAKAKALTRAMNLAFEYHILGENKMKRQQRIQMNKCKKE